MPAAELGLRRAVSLRAKVRTRRAIGLALVVSLVAPIAFAAKPTWAAFGFALVFTVVLAGTLWWGSHWRGWRRRAFLDTLDWYDESIRSPIDDLIDTGDLEGAAAALPALEGPQPWTDFTRERLRARIERAAGRPPDDDRLGAAIRQLSAEQARDATRGLAVDEAVASLGSGGDWTAPLATASPLARGQPRWRTRSSLLVAVLLIVLLAVLALSNWPPPAPFSPPATSSGYEVVYAEIRPSSGPFTGRLAQEDPAGAQAAIEILANAIASGRPLQVTPISSARWSSTDEMPVIHWAPEPHLSAPGVPAGFTVDQIYVPFGAYSRTGQPDIFIMFGPAGSQSLEALEVDPAKMRMAFDLLYPE